MKDPSGYLRRRKGRGKGSLVYGCHKMIGEEVVSIIDVERMQAVPAVQAACKRKRPQLPSPITST